MGVGIVPDVSNMGMGGKCDIYMHFFYTTRASGDFSPDGQCCVAATAL